MLLLVKHSSGKCLLVLYTTKKIGFHGERLQIEMILLISLILAMASPILKSSCVNLVLPWMSKTNSSLPSVYQSGTA